MSGRNGETRAGFASPRLFASYLHLHLAADPCIAERFVVAAAS
jgi:cobyrinic acid a,c-diamide synthase